MVQQKQFIKKNIMNNEVRTDFKYTVILDNCGNIDHNQDPNSSLYGTRSSAVKCVDFEHASNLCRMYIEKYNLGSGNWGGNAGIVLDTKGKKIAQVSYNGRVWGKNNKEIIL